MNPKKKENRPTVKKSRAVYSIVVRILHMTIVMVDYEIIVKSVLKDNDLVTVGIHIRC